MRHGQLLMVSDGEGWRCSRKSHLLYARMMLSTGPSPLTKGTSGRTARMLPTSGFWIPIATIATVAAMMMERQASSVSVLGGV